MSIFNTLILYLFKFLQKYLFADSTPMSPIISHMQSTPMLPFVSSKFTPLEFELSPIIRQDNTDERSQLYHRKNKLTPNSLDTSLSIQPILIKESNASVFPCIEEPSTSSKFDNIESNRIELSTWIGGENV